MDKTAREDLYRLAALLAEIERVMDPLAASDSTDFRVDPMPPPPLPPTGTAGGGALGGGSTARSAQEWLSIGGREPTRRGAGGQPAKTVHPGHASTGPRSSGAGQSAPSTDTSDKVPPSGAGPTVRDSGRPARREPVASGREAQRPSAAGPAHAAEIRLTGGQDRPTTVRIEPQDARVPAPRQWHAQSTTAAPRGPLSSLAPGLDRPPESQKPEASVSGTVPGIGARLLPQPLVAGRPPPPNTRVPAPVPIPGSHAVVGHRRPRPRRRSLFQSGDLGTPLPQPDFLDGPIADRQLHAPLPGLIDIRIPPPRTSMRTPAVSPAPTRSDQASPGGFVETEADVPRLEAAVEASGADLKEPETETVWYDDDPFDLLDLPTDRQGWSDEIGFRGLSASSRERIERRLRGRFLDRTLRRLP